MPLYHYVAFFSGLYGFLGEHGAKITVFRYYSAILMEHHFKPCSIRAHSSDAVCSGVSFKINLIWYASIKECPKWIRGSLWWWSENNSLSPQSKWFVYKSGVYSPDFMRVLSGFHAYSVRIHRECCPHQNRILSALHAAVVRFRIAHCPFFMRL